MVGLKLMLGSDEVIDMAEAGFLLGESPAAIYHRGLRGELELIRIDRTRWGCRRWELEAIQNRQPSGVPA